MDTRSKLISEVGPAFHPGSSSNAIHNARSCARIQEMQNKPNANLGNLVSPPNLSPDSIPHSDTGPIAGSQKWNLKKQSQSTWSRHRHNCMSYKHLQLVPPRQRRRKQTQCQPGQSDLHVDLFIRPPRAHRPGRPVEKTKPMSKWEALNTHLRIYPHTLLRAPHAQNKPDLSRATTRDLGNRRKEPTREHSSGIQVRKTKPILRL